MRPISSLSKAAQELAQLAEADALGTSNGGPLNLEKALRARPDLAAGLNELVAWHGENQREIAETTKPAKVGHDISAALEKLHKRKGMKRKKS